VIRLLVLYSASDRDSSPRIRAAARGMAGLRGLVVVKGSGRLEAMSENAEIGPAVELGFESSEAMHAALATQAWRVLAAAGGGEPPRLRAYHVDTLALGGAAGALDTTDLEVGEEEAMEMDPAEPNSNELLLPSRGVPPDDDEAA
jgi:hypothetical protein